MIPIEIYMAFIASQLGKSKSLTGLGPQFQTRSASAGKPRQLSAWKPDGFFLLPLCFLCVVG